VEFQEGDGTADVKANNPIYVGIGLIAAAVAFAVALILFEPDKPYQKTAPSSVAPVQRSSSAPGEVLLIRHGEEPKNGPDLNDQGRARANALVGLFEHPLMQPAQVFAAKSSKQSARPVQTCEPLAKAIGLTIDERFDEKDYKQLATAILQGEGAAGRTVMVCWKRETMPELATALGVANPPIEWPSEQYDHIWRISYAGGKVTMKDETQGIKLPGTEK